VAGEANEEAAWRNLVARYGAPSAPEGTAIPWPELEDMPPPPGSEQRAAGPGDPGSASGQHPGDPGSASGQHPGDPGTTAGQRPTATGRVPGGIPGPPHARIIRPAARLPLPGGDDDDHYVPPVPPPLPRLDPVTKGAWVALFGGPGYLLAAVIAGWAVPGWAAFGCVAAFVGGFATLVMRMPERPPRDSGPDDGAVV
jgi:hypothetical protein